MSNPNRLEELSIAVMELSMNERLELVQRILATVKMRFAPEDRVPQTDRSLYGLWSGTEISAEEIDAMRKEMWANFPRDDIAPEAETEQDILGEDAR